MTLCYNARRLFAWLALAAAGLAVVPAGLAAQETASREAPLLVQAANGARSIGTLLPGGRVAKGAPRGAWVAVTVEGYVDASVLGAKSDTFARTAKNDGIRVRTAANASAKVVAQLRKGTGVAVLGTSGRFVKVRRAAWVRAETFGAVAPAATASNRGVRPVPVAAPEGPPALIAQPAAETAVPVPDGALKPGPGGADVRMAPEARSLATIKPGAVLTPLARDRGWVRVRLEGWVRERDLQPADTALRGLRAAADLRADPEGTKGAVVRWTVDILGLQTADGLRRDLTEGEPYLLARGPVGEEALLYLAVPPSLLDAARAWPPSTRALVTARVRTGRSEPTGVPVLDLQALTKP